MGTITLVNLANFRDAKQNICCRCKKNPRFRKQAYCQLCAHEIYKERKKRIDDENKFNL